MKFDKYDNDSLINFYIENGLEFDERKKYFGNNIRSFALLENENIIEQYLFQYIKEKVLLRH